MADGSLNPNVWQGPDGRSSGPSGGNGASPGSGNPWTTGPGGGPGGGPASWNAPGVPDRPGSGIAVGGWVPFANYLNTQDQLHYGASSDPTQSGQSGQPKQPIDPGAPNAPGPSAPGPNTPGPRAPGPDTAPGLVAGPGLGGYYGQLSQQYLTGKRQ